ncbi:MAG: phospholipase D-like domain-containing protein [Fimbriiglobus sp.]
MKLQELDTLLNDMLADQKLTGSERTTLMAWAAKHLDSEPDRGAARRRAFEAAASAISDDEVHRVLVWLEEVLKVFQAGSKPAEVGSTAHFSPGADCLGQILHRLQNARQSLDICVFTITDDRITRAILEAHRRGVKVRVITDNDKANDLGSDIAQLEAANVPLKVDRTAYHMHHKFAIIDRNRLLNGSYNWTRSAAQDNEENLTDCGDTKLISAFQTEFDKLWASLT